MVKLLMETFEVVWRIAKVRCMASSQIRSERRWLVTVTERHMSARR